MRKHAAVGALAVLLLGICSEVTGQDTCGKKLSQLTSIGSDGMSREDCLKLELDEGRGCWKDGDCYLTPASNLRRRTRDKTADFRRFLGGQRGYTKPDERQLRKFQNDVEKAGGDSSAGVSDSGALKRSARRLSLGGLGGGLGGLLTGKLFPECPVHVKYCYRVPCGGFNRPDLQNNPYQCMSDPRCCYDYALAFMRSIFGPRFMSSTPTCYYGATSKQWLYVTGLFKPWNPWLAVSIRDAFEEVFNTGVFNFGGQLACSIGGGTGITGFARKAYPVGEKSKVQCNLVSGCWDGTKPPGSRCSMVSDFVMQALGQQQVYPSLFTNDPSDTQCSANWFDYGPKAYRRMPCSIGAPPPGIFDKLFRWCPSTDCCLNYLALDGLSATDMILLQGFGGAGGGLGGFPFSGPSFGTSPNVNLQNIQYLILASQGSASSDLSDLFCPYRLVIKSSLFPELEDLTEGCCDIPTCYHKKKLVSFTNPRPPVQARWGGWGNCEAACGRPGTQRRRCLVGNREQPGFCSGPDSQPCSGPPCPVTGTWGPWQQTSACSVQCGSGTAQYTRQCYVNGQQSFNPAACPGGQTSQTQNRPCSMPPCTPAPVFGTWSQWQRVQPCNVQCGQGTTRWRRICLVNGQQSQNPAVCPNGQTVQNENRPCTRPPCGPAYKWNGVYVQLQACPVECGSGMAYWGQQCVDRNNQVVSGNLCSGSQPFEQRPCSRPPCRPTASWTEWRVTAPCGGQCGNQVEVSRRYCVLSTGGLASDTSLCGPGRDFRVRSCDTGCQYYWSNWEGDRCEKDSFGRYCQGNPVRQRYRTCYEKLPNGTYRRMQDQTRCGLPPNQYQQTVPCSEQECARYSP